MIHGTMEAECQMKQSVIELVCQLGAPIILEGLMFDGLTKTDNKIIEAIINGAKTKKDIADFMGVHCHSVQTYLTRLYDIAETNGKVFERECNRLPELIEFIKQHAKDKTND